VTKISAIIPAFNEEKTIARTVEALAGISDINEIIVVDDGSRDDTAGSARIAGAHIVIGLKSNQGKGQALNHGVGTASGQVLCFVDADLGDSAAEFKKLLAPVLADRADMTIAQWPRSGKKAGFGLVMGLARFGIRRLTGFDSSSPLSGQRVLRRSVWESATFLDSGFGIEVGLTVECLRNGYRVLEVPVLMGHRETGRDLAGFTHRGRQFVQVARTLYGAWRQKARLQ
jgi:glycosyltransferase involved in cell wall biosynthesis